MSFVYWVKIFDFKHEKRKRFQKEEDGRLKINV